MEAPVFTVLCETEHLFGKMPSDIGRASSTLLNFEFVGVRVPFLLLRSTSSFPSQIQLDHGDASVPTKLGQFGSYSLSAILIERRNEVPGDFVLLSIEVSIPSFIKGFFNKNYLHVKILDKKFKKILQFTFKIVTFK